MFKGDWETARDLVERWVAGSRTGNVLAHLPAAVAMSALVLAQLGEAGEALNRYREGDQLLERLGQGLVALRGWIDLSLGRAALLLGRTDEARHFGDRVVEHSRQQPGPTAHALHLLGDVATAPDRLDAERAGALYRQALSLAAHRGMRPLIAHCRLGLGKLDHLRGHREEAREHLGAAATMYREMDMRFWLETAEAEMRPLGWRQEPDTNQGGGA